MSAEKSLEVVTNTIFYQRRFIGVAAVVLDFSMKNSQFFTVLDIDIAYRASRYMTPERQNTRVVKHMADMVGIDMITPKANTAGTIHYGLLESGLWGIVSAYSAAMDERFPDTGGASL